MKGGRRITRITSERNGNDDNTNTYIVLVIYTYIHTLVQTNQHINTHAVIHISHFDM